MVGSAVCQVVSIDRGQYDVFDTELSDRSGKPLRLFGVCRQRSARFGIAEAAATSTYIAENHKSGSASTPTFCQIRTSPADTNRMQAVLFQRPANKRIAIVAPKIYLQPLGFSSYIHRTNKYVFFAVQN